MARISVRAICHDEREMKKSGLCKECYDKYILLRLYVKRYNNDNKRKENTA